MLVYTCVFLFAVYLNRNCNSSLLLALLVGLSYYLPVEMIRSQPFWFITCISMEIFVALSALSLVAYARYAVAGVAFMLAMSHTLFWEFRTLHTYYFIVNYLEYLEIISCCLFSTTVIQTIKERVKRCLPQKF